MRFSVLVFVIFVITVTFVSESFVSASQDEVNNVCDARIVGGCPATAHEFPHQLSLRFEEGEKHFCGASLISDQLGLTAAHCVNHMDPSKFLAVAGDHSLKQAEGTEQFRLLRRVVVHEKWGKKGHEWDIALLIFSSPFHLQEKTVWPIRIPNANYNASGEAVVTGWGRTSPPPNITYPEVLMKLQVPIISDQKCREYYDKDSIADSIICAGFEEGGKNGCHGDSGGPLVSLTDGLLIGIVSGGSPECSPPRKPGIYTEVAHFKDWIMKNSLLQNLD